MVTRILFDPRTDNPDGTQAALQAVTIEATPTGIREDGSVFILPSTLTFATSTGAAPILLSAPSASTAWRLAVKNAGQLRQTRIVRFPDVPSITWAALTDVDPASLGTTPGHARQWDATFAELVTLIGSGGSGYLPLWKANTAYTAGQFVVSPTGQIIQANTTFTSGSTYNAANWTVVTGGGGGGAVSSVAGRTGAVTLTAADVALGNVNNTSDAAKPISTAQAAVNAAKADLVGGLVPTSQIPALALNTSVTVASQAAMLALTTSQVQPGDLAIRTDGAGTFILTATDPTQLGNWARLNAPTDVVTTVNGQNGTVVLAKGDVGLGSVDNTSDVGKPVSTAQATAIGAKLDALAAPVTLNASGTMTAGAWNLLDATSGVLTATLPTPTKIGQRLIAERQDAGTNLISFAGTVRGVTTGLPTFPGLGVRGESIDFEAESLTSWRIIASHKPKALLDQQFASLAALSTLIAYVDNGDGTATITGPGITDNGDGTITFTSSAGSVLYKKSQLDTLLAAKAPLASPAFTGTPTAPTPATADSSTAVATTAFVKAQGYGAGGGGATVNVQTFTANGTWTKPAGVTTVQVVIIGAGAGGGSGRRTASGAVAGGGGGGGGGGMSTGMYPAAALPATVAVTCASGGNGGTAVGTDSTNGAAGSPGGASLFGLFLQANGGNNGSGGTTAGGTSGGSASSAQFQGSGGAAGGAGAAGVQAGLAQQAAAGGGGGGGISVTPAAFNGGAGGTAITTGNTAAAGTAGGPGTAGLTAAAGAPIPVGGGAGGASSITAAGGAGGAGGSYGGGGGGGGASLNGFASGAGGQGGPGIVVVTSW